MRDKPSHTALKIARGLISLGRDERWDPLLPEGTLETTRAMLEASGLLGDWGDENIIEPVTPAFDFLDVVR